MLDLLKLAASHWALIGILSVVAVVVVAVVGSLGPATLLLHWKAVLGAIVVLGLIVLSVVLYVSLEREVAEVAKAQESAQAAIGQVAVLQSSNADLARTIVTQNGALTQLQALASARAQAAAAAQVAAAKQRANDDKSLATLKKRIADPAVNKGSCDEELAHLRAGL
ncbi:hypothetical protein [Burkholderia anthina]|uniref:hypothetical protein n=1 Tax=Burkholderia anthina TaxID=179879 RepID=UPI00158E7AA7|nr:hypothetical protein [Burkholderia anthina]